MRKSFIGLVVFAFLLIVGCNREDATPQTTIDDISEEIDTLVIDSTDVNPKDSGYTYDFLPDGRKGNGNDNKPRRLHKFNN